MPNKTVIAYDEKNNPIFPQVYKFNLLRGAFYTEIQVSKNRAYTFCS